MLALAVVGCGGRPSNTIPSLTLLMDIQSSAFVYNDPIPSVYTCDGKNVSPPLSILDVPAEAASLVLISDDPDAPAGTWVHWLVWNIDPSTTAIAEGSSPSGSVEGTTSFGKTGYGGPCPPSGTHRYFFKLYALDSTLDLASDADKAALEAAMEGHILDQAETMGVYSRE